MHIESWPVLLAITVPWQLRVLLRLWHLPLAPAVGTAGSQVMGRWVMFTWTCRAFPWAGEKILPVLQAWAVPVVASLGVNSPCSFFLHPKVVP